MTDLESESRATTDVNAVYSKIFKKLVQSDQDLIGLLAYGLYKRDKIGYVQAFVRETNSSPIKQDFDQFHRTTMLDNQLGRYREQATRILNDFSDDLLSETANEIKDSIYAGSEAISEIAKLNKSFWRSVFENVIAGFVGAIITVALSVLLFVWISGDSEKMLKAAMIRWASQGPATSQPAHDAK